MATADKHVATAVVLGGKNSDGLVRFSHLHVFNARINKISKKEEYSLQLMIPKSDAKSYEALKAAIAEQQKILWPSGKLPPKAHYPLKDGDTNVNQKGEDAFVPGHWLVSAKSYASNDKGEKQAPPGVVGTTRGEDGKLKPLSQSQIKSGDWGRCSLNAKSYDKGDSGVAFYINNIQLVREGEALASRKSAADEFDDYADDEEAFDPLA